MRIAPWKPLVLPRTVRSERARRPLRLAALPIRAVAAAATPLVLALLVFLFGSVDLAPRAARAPELSAVLGAQKLGVVYERWLRARESSDGAALAIALRAPDAGRPGSSGPQGRVRLDPLQGTLSLQAQGLPAGELRAWLLDRHCCGAADDGAALALGTLQRDGAIARLSARIDPVRLADLQLDRIVVTRAGEQPGPALLEGAPSLFQKQYAASLRAGAPAAVQSDAAAPPSLGTRVASASAAQPRSPADLARLIERGRRIFTTETFGGNGRTCATCHPLERNTTLGVSDIAALPDTDPLFVAEFRPSLAFAAAGPKFEVPLLLRGNALILENVDGFEDLSRKFVLRSINHLLALPTSLAPEPVDGTATPPAQRTGWSGDGAPDDGSLRAFAKGAVIQHFTRSLQRVPGTDFRLPSEDELDALEAFQLSLGRSEDVVLPLAFRNPVIRRGQQLFRSVGSSDAGNCALCHFNAGAAIQLAPGVMGGNSNFNTGIEDQVDRPAVLMLREAGLDLAPDAPGRFVPPDGGFGTRQSPKDPTGELGLPGSLADGFGDSGFNTPPIIEAADTPPFFHDNSIRTIEGAVAFYNSEAFNKSFSGSNPLLQTHMEATQVEAIAGFLRVLNALENMRETREIASALLAAGPRASERDVAALVEQAETEIADAIEVLAGQDLHPEVVAILHRVSLQLRAARIARVFSALGPQIVQLLDRARAAILDV